MTTGFRQRQGLAQRQMLAPQMRQGLKLLQMDVGELREELYREMAENPVIEDIEQVIDRHTTGEVERASEAQARADESDWPDDEVAEDSYYTADADALDRRQRFFDSRTRPETLAEHLRRQLGLLGLSPDDRALAETLVGSLDEDGRFVGSIPDLVMVTGASAARVRDLLRVLATLDPPGCGATTLEECLLAQTDRIDEPHRDELRELIAHHLPDLAAKDYAKVESALGLSRERLEDDLELLRTLEPHPGRAFAPATADEAYIHPEVHAVRDGSGRWMATVDERDLPTVFLSKRYAKMLADPATDAETRAYIRRKVEAVEMIRTAINQRYDTIRNIAQAIFDAQPGFFREGAKGLKPLTMQEVAAKVGVNHTTVSRTVNGKYASTPFGTVELRAFFVAGLVNAAGEEVAKDEVLDRLKALIEGEDKSAPLSDDRLAGLLKAAGFPVARRTVAKYRNRLGIPGAAARR